MLIVNADDFGKNCSTTDRIISCFKRGSLTSTSAMVYMEDSKRAADLAKVNNIRVGLHLNFTQKLTNRNGSELLLYYHECIRRFLTNSKYNLFIYNPALKEQFKYVFKAQIEEFERIYGHRPAHIDGHHHMHLCANMLVQLLVPKGSKVRRNFTYFKGEKSAANRIYRSLIDKLLARRYGLTDYLFSLPEQIKFGRLERVFRLAKSSNVELETHPESDIEFNWLMNDAFSRSISGIKVGR